MQFRNVTEEQSVLGHRVVDACAGQNQPVGTPETRQHDGARHQQAAYCAEHLIHHSSGNAILARKLDAAL